MRNKNWVESEIATIKNSTLSHAECARMLNRSEESVRYKRRVLKVSINPVTPVAVTVEETSVEQDVAVLDESYWKGRCNELGKKYDRLVKEKSVVDRLIADIKQMAPVSYSPLPPVAPIEGGIGKPQSAVLLFSDTHIGKVTKPTQTLHFGEYNFSVFMARLKRLESAIISICKNHVTTEIPELVIAMLGDMLDGTLTHSNEIGQADPIFNQFYCGAHVIAQFFRNLAPHFPKIRVYDTVGNHTRFQGQRRMPTKNRYSNFDNFLYALVRELIRDIPNIEWELDAQPYEIFDVQGFTFFAAHGDSLRGGDKALGVPNHAVGRLVSTASQMMTKYGRKNPNYYVVGHLHRDIVLPHATGSFIVNGGFPGVDEFGLAEMFVPADPTQKLFFMHPAFGKTASYDISLKFAKVTPEAPYSSPSIFDLN